MLEFIVAGTKAWQEKYDSQNWQATCLLCGYVCPTRPGSSVIAISRYLFFIADSSGAVTHDYLSKKPSLDLQKAAV